MTGKTYNKVQREPCGCEFTTYVTGDTGFSCLNYVTYMTKCRCKKHYDEQFTATFDDATGTHTERIEPENPLPLETDTGLGNEN